MGSPPSDGPSENLPGGLPGGLSGGLPGVLVGRQEAGSADEPADCEEERGQLYLDFVVGVGIFLLALAFLVGAVPGLFAAGDDRPAGPLVADRTVDRIAGPLLGSEAGPSTLDGPCTVAFFGESDADCEFDPTASLQTQVGLGTDYDVNVSLVRPAADGTGREPLCLAGAEIRRCGSGSPVATVGPSIADEGANVVVAHRSVFVDGRDATLVVRVW